MRLINVDRREREMILDLFEEFCGARLTYNSMRIGGLPQDLPPGWDKKVLQFCDIMDEKVTEYEELLTHNRIWLERTKGIGLITGEQAVALGDRRAAIDGRDMAVARKLCLIGTQPHGATQIAALGANLLAFGAHPFGNDADNRLACRAELSR